MARKKTPKARAPMDALDAARSYVVEALGETIADGVFVDQLHTFKVFTLGGGADLKPEDARAVGIFAQAWVAGFRAAEREAQRNTGHAERSKAAADRREAIRKTVERLKAERKTATQAIEAACKEFKVARATVYNALAAGAG